MDNDDLRYKPTGYSYRVDENVWAGEYPVWDWDRATRGRQVKLYTDFGINTFLDLTEDGEMPPYIEFLLDSIRRITFPFPNGGVPESPQSLMRLFEEIDQLFHQFPETMLYIHCVGGVGRTGVIVACYYIYFKGMSPDAALTEMHRRFATHGRSAWMSAPETEAQVNFIMEFATVHTGV